MSYSNYNGHSMTTSTTVKPLEWDMKVNLLQESLRKQIGIG